MTPTDCAFCRRVAEGPFVLERPLVVAFADAFPVAQGHTLVIPRRHEGSLFDLSSAEYSAAWSAVADVRRVLDDVHHPDGFTVGVNVGAAAGQTAGHAHIHVIPRKNGDVADPRGGVRWVLPDQAPYWRKP